MWRAGVASLPRSEAFSSTFWNETEAAADMREAQAWQRMHVVEASAALMSAVTGGPRLASPGLILDAQELIVSSLRFREGISLPR